jgi:SAM-dependent methyltransferase/glycosyltransferase involved in cell wall biosynthesis
MNEAILSGEDSLEWTGERYLPEIQGDVALEHLHRYAMAKELVRGKTVLDLASGEGYGSSILAQAAGYVYGVDLSREAIEHAAQKYAAPNLEFLIGDCAEVPLADHSVDMVVSFETIEHHDRHEEMMREIKRVLRPGGWLVISNPEKYEYSIAPGYNNPYHVKELFRHQFADLIAGHFKHVAFYGQRVLYGSAILPEDDYGPLSCYIRKGFEQGPSASIPKPLYLIALASDAELPSLAGGIFEEPVRDSEIGLEIAERDGRIGDLIRDGAAKDAQIDDLRDTLALRDGRIGDLIRDGADKDAQIDDLRDTLALRDGRIGDLIRDGADKDAQIDDLKNSLAERDGRIGDLIRDGADKDAQIDDLKNSLAERDGRIGGLIRDGADQDARIDDLKDSLAERDGRIGDLIRVGADKDAQIDDLKDSLAERDGRIGELIRAGADKDGQINGLNQAIAEGVAQTGLLRLALEEREAQIGALDGVVAELRQQTAEQQHMIASILGSTSWKLSKPVRVLGRLLRGARPNSQPADGEAPTPAETAAALPWPEDQGDAAASQAILLVSYYCPTRAHAGGLRILDIYAFIKERYPSIRLELYTHQRPEIDGSYEGLEDIFDEIHYCPHEPLTLDWLQRKLGRAPRYRVVDLQFHQSAYELEAFRAVAGKILFTPMESLARSLVLDIKAGLSGQAGTLKKCRANLKCAMEELKFAKTADQTVCVSKTDAAFLRALTGSKKVRYLETGISMLEFPILKAGAEQPCLDAAQKANLVLFVAYFGSDTNVEALKWFLDEVHPMIKAEVPNYRLEVVGRGDLSPFEGYADPALCLVGAVPSISPYIEKAKVGIAPALGGSGFRGKVNQYALFGVPTVASPISANGLAYQDQQDIFIAHTPALFAQRCIELLTDNALNNAMGAKARATCMQKYTWDARADAIARYYNLEGL